MTCNCVSWPHRSAQAIEADARVADVAALVGSSVPVSIDPVITGVSDHSGSVAPGDLYLALPGRTAHGLEFEAEAHARGAVAVLSDRAGRLLPSIVVDDPRRWAGPVSSHIHSHPSRSLAVYGVTGTNGKTSTTYLLDAALTAAGETVATITGISISGPNSAIPATRTTPEAARLQRSLARFRDEGATAAVMEVSSHAATHGRVDGTCFAAMGFTNLGRDHLDFHGTMDNYFAAKRALFTPERTAAAAIGIDDHYGRRLAAAAAVDMPCWTWSALDPAADVFGERIVCTATGTSMTARTPHGSFDVALPLLGPHQALNALAAITVVAAADKDLGAAIDGLERVATVPGRLERIDEGQPFLALVDYMHNTAGQHQLLPYVRTLTAGKVIVVIGATGDRDPGKRFPLGATAAAFADVVIVSDESPYTENASVIRNAVAAGAIAARSATVIVEPDRRTACAVAVAHAAPGDVVVMTGRGCDTAQVFGTTVASFDDRTELRRAVRARMSTAAASD